MANFSNYFPSIISSEGAAFEVVPGDSGGCTKYGIIADDLHEFNVDIDKDGKIDCADVKSLTQTDAFSILKKLYWDFFKADTIINQSVAEYIVDGAFNQGRVLIAKYVQQILGVTVDGQFGPKTIQTLNAADQQKIFSALKDKRIARYNAIVESKPNQLKFLKGWIRRANSITFKS